MPLGFLGVDDETRLHFCQRQKLRFAAIQLAAATLARVAFMIFESRKPIKKRTPIGVLFFMGWMTRLELAIFRATI